MIGLVILADFTLGMRQALASGRVSDSISGRGLDAFGAALHYSFGGKSGVFPTTVTHKTDGWYALQLVPGMHMPELVGAGAVTLTVQITVPGRAPLEISQVVDSSRLAVVRSSLFIKGSTVAVYGLAGAPVEFSVAVPPRPVALSGKVVRNHDVEDPVLGVVVRAHGGSIVGPLDVEPLPDGPTAVSDAGGRFFLAPLPVAKTVTVTAIEGEKHRRTVIRPDYSTPVNTVTLSLVS